MISNIKKTPSHRINKKTRDKLKEINTSAFVDVMARQFGYDPHTILMDNVIPLNNGERLVSRAVTIRYLPSRNCLLYTSPSPRDKTVSRMPSSA